MSAQARKRFIHLRPFLSQSSISFWRSMKNANQMMLSLLMQQALGEKRMNTNRQSGTCTSVPTSNANKSQETGAISESNSLSSIVKAAIVLRGRRSAAIGSLLPVEKESRYLWRRHSPSPMCRCQHCFDRLHQLRTDPSP